MVLLKRHELEQKENGYKKYINENIGKVDDVIKEYSCYLDKLKLNFYKKQALLLDFEECYEKLKREAEEINDPQMLALLQNCYSVIKKECNEKFPDPKQLRASMAGDAHVSIKF